MVASHAPASRQTAEQREPPSVFAVASRPGLGGLESRARVGHVDPDAPWVDANAEVDRLLLREAGMENAVGDQLAHEQNGLVEGAAIQARAHPLESAASRGGCSRVRGQRDIEIEHLVG